MLLKSDFWYIIFIKRVSLSLFFYRCPNHDFKKVSFSTIIDIFYSNIKDFKALGELNM